MSRGQLTQGLPVRRLGNVLVAVAVCPHPPMLVPAVAAAAAAELGDLRAASSQAVSRVVGAAPDLVCVVGDGPAVRWYGEGDAGSLRPYGVPFDIALDTVVSGAPALPLALTVGAWLLHEAGWLGGRRALGLPGHVADAHLDRLAAELAGFAARVALLVMGDGSARRTEKAPGYIDPRAEGFDRAVATALAQADTSALAELDQRLGDDLLAAGTASWRLLGRAAAGLDWKAELLSDTAPYGVGYFVAAWERRP
ncbi:MAG: class III extradiol dioxygenase subunit B-like domain-containing protein [Actinomycetota bacterium]|nr:class III extradiol dioxygenase subunit B-like domain-containing protein [Actinomycetota bacterium]